MRTGRRKTSRGEVAYDGQVSVTRPGAFRALVFRGREWWATDNEYYDLMMQHAGSEDDPGGGHTNRLVSIARAETTKLRPDVEMVEGHPCRVLDAYESGPTETVGLAGLPEGIPAGASAVLHGSQSATAARDGV